MNEQIKEEASNTPQWIFYWDAKFPGQWNALFADEEKSQFFLGDLYCESGEEVRKGVHPVTVADALEWYEETSRYAANGGATGDVSLLCRVAAQQLKECGK